MSQIRYSPKSTSMGSGTDGSGYEMSCVVNVNWNADNSKWNVNTWNRNDNRWNAGNRVLSRETRPACLPHPSSGGGSFCDQSFPPTAEHPPELVQLLR